MSAALLLARRGLGRSRVRLIASVGGVALALSLTLALDAIYAGVANQLTAYIDRAGADVWVAQSGVRSAQPPGERREQQAASRRLPARASANITGPARETCFRWCRSALAFRSRGAGGRIAAHRIFGQCTALSRYSAI